MGVGTGRTFADADAAAASHTKERKAGSLTHLATS
jgi:hypothetical protein